MLEGQQEAREDMRQIRADLAELRGEMERQRDETAVMSGIVMRYAGERIAWGAMQNQLRKVSERLEVLEQRVP